MRTAILISGRGSTMQALLDLAARVRVTLVVSSKGSALGLFRAKRMGMQTLVLDKQIDFETLHRQLKSRGIQRIFLAGFMKVIPGDFIAKWRGKIVNVHPSLLPLHPGLNGFEKSLESGSGLGATVHEVTEELDGGPRLCQVQFFSPLNKQKHLPELSEAQIWLSFCEQRLVREVVKIWS